MKLVPVFFDWRDELALLPQRADLPNVLYSRYLRWVRAREYGCIRKINRPQYTRPSEFLDSLRPHRFPKADRPHSTKASGSTGATGADGVGVARGVVFGYWPLEAMGVPQVLIPMLLDCFANQRPLTTSSDEMKRLRALVPTLRKAVQTASRLKLDKRFQRLWHGCFSEWRQSMTEFLNEALEQLDEIDQSLRRGPTGMKRGGRHSVLRQNQVLIRDVLALLQGRVRLTVKRKGEEAPRSVVVKQGGVAEGMVLKNFTQKTVKSLCSAMGVRVMSVTPKSAGDQAGLLPDDIVVAVFDQRVSSVESLKRVWETLLVAQQQLGRRSRLDLAFRIFEWLWPPLPLSEGLQPHQAHRVVPIIHNEKENEKALALRKREITVPHSINPADDLNRPWNKLYKFASCENEPRCTADSEHPWLPPVRCPVREKRIADSLRKLGIT